MKKMLILGSSGLVGNALVEEFQNDFDLYGTFASTPPKLLKGKQIRLDITQIEKIEDVLHSIKPDIIVSCIRGGYEQQLEFHKEFALKLKNGNKNFYYFSTTNIFDHDLSKYHLESDIPNAESDYGIFKIQCESILKEILGDRAIIIRIPAIWGKNSPRLKLIKESLQKNQEINVYSNLFRSNLLDTHLSKQLRYIIEKNLNGIFHLGSEDLMTESEFYTMLINAFSGNLNILRTNLYKESKENFFFGLKSSRENLPSFFHTTNFVLIKELTIQQQTIH